MRRRPTLIFAAVLCAATHLHGDAQISLGPAAVIMADDPTSVSAGLRLDGDASGLWPLSETVTVMADGGIRIEGLLPGPTASALLAGGAQLSYRGPSAYVRVGVDSHVDLSPSYAAPIADVGAHLLARMSFAGVDLSLMPRAALFWGERIAFDAQARLSLTFAALGVLVLEPAVDAGWAVVGDDRSLEPRIAASLGMAIYPPLPVSVDISLGFARTWSDDTEVVASLTVPGYYAGTRYSLGVSSGALLGRSVELSAGVLLEYMRTDHLNILLGAWGVETEWNLLLSPEAELMVRLTPHLRLGVSARLNAALSNSDYRRVTRADLGASLMWRW